MDVNELLAENARLQSSQTINSQLFHLSLSLTFITNAEAV